MGVSLHMGYGMNHRIMIRKYDHYCQLLSIIPSIIHMGGWDCWLEFTLFGKISINENIKYPQFVFNIFIWGGACWGRDLFTDRKWVNNHCHLPQEDFLRNQQVLMENPPFPIDSQRPGRYPIIISRIQEEKHTKTYQKPTKIPFNSNVPSIFPSCHLQWIGLRENLQDSPIFNGKIDGFL